MRNTPKIASLAFDNLGRKNLIFVLEVFIRLISKQFPINSKTHL